MSLIATKTLGEEAYCVMRRMIVVGELPAGQWIRKRAMARKLRMSATPIVEAIRRLEHEGLVETDPPWGARVRIFTVPEIFELASMRVVLEGLVARCAASRVTPKQIESLREIAIRVDQADNDFADHLRREESPLGALASEDINLHLKLAEEAGLPIIRQELERLQILNATCRAWLAPAVQCTVTHVDIIDAIASGDPDRAEAVMRKHIQENIDGYMPSLRKRFGEGRVVEDGHVGEGNFPKERM
jgi:DNA-binding GntR family transcriptional regulator